METVMGAEKPSRRILVAADGRGVEILAANVGDFEVLRGMFSRSSGKTIYNRFHSPYPRVPDSLLTYLLDPQEHGGQALVAVSGGEIVGHAMFARPDAGEAEVGVVVEDGWQSRGVGGGLLHELSLAAMRRGVETFVCTALGENRRVPPFVGSVFAEARTELRDGLRVVRAPLRSLRSRRGTVDAAR